MKRVPSAPSLDLARLSETELSDIYQSVLATRAQAEANIRTFRAAAAEGAPACGVVSAAAASAPATNRGGKSEETRKTIAATLVLEDGKILEIPARRTWGGSEAFLDWVNFTTDESDFFFGLVPVTDEQFIDRVSCRLKEILGYGITKQRDAGANFYHRSYVLGDAYGMVCHGGQRDTVLVMISGEGCAAAREGWEQRLYDFLSKQCGTRAKLTRVDLAHDDYQGATYSVDRADADFDAGLFNTGGRNPNHEYRGNWKRPTGKGRTLYIGKRENGKFARIYEKGRQLGDKNSEWVRIEVEMKAVNRLLEFEILLYPGRYLAAAYPAFGWISEHQERIVTTQKKTEITYKSIVDWLKRQCGPAINVMMAIEENADVVIQKIIRDAIPARMKVPFWQTAGESIHEQERYYLPKDVVDAMWMA
ncbi:replication initiation factor domain-containing protein [Propionivibrio limicola]|uniref:replication initiation factor domain-containing protein n=1 Tax=Propionivibrio limicola TaxID=167645 RepID=UPI001290EB09|nr:replication initiation factor domain-containing protein [Propionivibrio limicola]